MKNLSKSQRIYSQLIKNVGEHIKRYKTDLTEHDKKFIFDKPNTPFIHCTRRTGTSIYPLYKLEEWPQDDEPIKYLFSYATRKQILEGQISALRSSIEENDLFFYYNRTALWEITPQRAISIYSHYADSLKRKWEGRNQPIPASKVMAI